MGKIQFWGNQILFIGSRIAMSPNCCCFGDDPCASGCSACIPDSDEFDVTIGEIVALGTTGGGYYYCTDEECNVFNGTFRLTRATDRPCTWRYFFPERYPEDPRCQGGTLGPGGHLEDYWPYSLELTWNAHCPLGVPRYYPYLNLIFHLAQVSADLAPWPRGRGGVAWQLPEGLDDCKNVSGLEMENMVLIQERPSMCHWLEATALLNSVPL